MRYINNGSMTTNTLPFSYHNAAMMHTRATRTCLETIRARFDNDLEFRANVIICTISGIAGALVGIMF